jgi:hypothetical protein
MRIQASNQWRATHFLVFVALVVSTLAFAPQPPAKATVPTCAEGGTCLVGNVGPAGGIVIYVGDTTINVATGISIGGKYLEARTNLRHNTTPSLTVDNLVCKWTRQFPSH